MLPEVTVAPFSMAFSWYRYNTTSHQPRILHIFISLSRVLSSPGALSRLVTTLVHILPHVSTTHMLSFRACSSVIRCSVGGHRPCHRTPHPRPRKSHRLVTPPGESPHTPPLVQHLPRQSYASPSSAPVGSARSSVVVRTHTRLACHGLVHQKTSSSSTSLRLVSTSCLGHTRSRYCSCSRVYLFFLCALVMHKALDRGPVAPESTCSSCAPL